MRKKSGNLFNDLRITVFMLGWLTVTCEFESHCVPHTSGTVT